MCIWSKSFCQKHQENVTWISVVRWRQINQDSTPFPFPTERKCSSDNLVCVRRHIKLLFLRSRGFVCLLRFTGIRRAPPASRCPFWLHLSSTGHEARERNGVTVRWHGRARFLLHAQFLVPLVVWFRDQTAQQSSQIRHCDHTYNAFFLFLQLSTRVHQVYCTNQQFLVWSLTI